jgi:ribokinase
MARPVILTTGSLHLDLILSAPHLPRPDETVAGTGVVQAFGGKGGNQAVAAARMGAESHMAGAVGDDGFAAALLAGLDAAGVDRRQVRVVPGPSGMSVAILDPAGTYGAVIVSGANLSLDADGVVFPPGCGTLMLQNEVPETVNLRLAARARAKGLRVVLNAAPARAMAPALLSLTDVLVVNRGEAAAILGATPPPQEAARALRARGPAEVLVTLGEGGVAGPDFLQPARAVSVISTHGAGDAFTGALAVALAGGAGLEDGAAFAQGAAALHVATPPAARGGIDAHKVRAL